MPSSRHLLIHKQIQSTNPVADETPRHARSIRWLVTANNVVAIGFIMLGLAIIGFAVFMGAFAWLNNGLAAGLGLLIVAGSLGAAFLVTGWCFVVIARAHANASRFRWWLQIGLPLISPIFFGLAAELSSLADRLSR